METMFKAGQTVKALTTVQGLEKGREYVVRDVSTNAQPWGFVTTYVVEPTTGPVKTLHIVNGHLLMAAV